MLPISQPPASGKGAGEWGEACPVLLDFCFVWIYFAKGNDFYNIKKRENAPFSLPPKLSSFRLDFWRGYPLRSQG